MESVTRAILDLWQVLAAEPDMGRLLTSVVRAAEIATGATFGEIVLTNDSWTRLEYQFAQPAELALLESLRNRLGRRIIGVVTNAQATLQVEEPATPSPGSGIPQAARHRETMVDSALRLPLQVEGTHIGFLTLFNKPGGFSADDREFMVTFLGQVSTTIEREVMRVRLTRIETRLQGIFEAIGDGLLVCDRHGKPILANRAFRTMFFPPGQPNEALPAVLPPLLENPADTGLQEVVLLKPHARVLSSSFVRTRDETGKVHEMILSLRDITHSKRLDQKFLQLISILIRRMERLVTALGKKRRPRTRRRVWHRLRVIVCNLVHLSELKAGPLRVDKLPLTVREWLEEAKPRLETRLAKSGHGLHWPALPDEADEMVFADGGALQRALRTLVAFHTGRLAAGTTIDLRLALEQGAWHLRLITPRAAWKSLPDPALLDWQSCLDRFLEETRRGFFLGLAFIRQVMEAHKGMFSCTVAEDHVVFLFTLPSGAF